MRILHQEPLVIQDNVRQFKVSVLQSLLGHFYDFDVMWLPLEELGWPVCRDRQFIIMRHNVKTPVLFEPFALAQSLFLRKSSLTHKDFLIAPESELATELQWAMGRKMRKGRGKGNNIDATIIVPTNETRFEDALTESELTNLRLYEKFYGKDRVYSLCQSANRHPQFSSKITMHTIIKNVGLAFSVPGKRWYAPRELLAMQGFPVYGFLEGQLGCKCSCSYPRERRRNAMGGQAGNSFNLNQIGVVLLWTLTHTRRAEETVCQLQLLHAIAEASDDRRE